MVFHFVKLKLKIPLGSNQLRADRADLSSATNSARIIKSMIPVPYLKSRYTMNQLRDLATDMPIDSVIVGIHLFLIFITSFLTKLYFMGVLDADLVLEAYIRIN